jgi:hypothetical protein
MVLNSYIIGFGKNAPNGFKILIKFEDGLPLLKGRCEKL